MPFAIIFRKDIFDGDSTEDTRSSNFNASIVSTLSNKVAIKMNEIWSMLSFYEYLGSATNTEVTY